jgi:hypothetical protein
MSKYLFISFLNFLLFFTFITSSYAQSVEPDTAYIPTVETDSIVSESAEKIKMEAISVVRFSSSASAYLKWSIPSVSPSAYTLRFKILGGSSWTTGTTSSLEKIISNLQLDTSYICEFVPVGVVDSTKYASSCLISTYEQTEPIIVSHNLYNELSEWFVDDSPTKTFCELIDESDVALFEKLAFLQKYIFDNESFVNAGSSTDFSDWYPSRVSSLTNETCIPEWLTDCRCQVITDGANHASPGNTDFLNAKITPKVVDKVAKSNNNKRTYVDRYEAGTAKFIGLHQDEARGMEYEMSNLSGADDPTAVSPSVSSIQFILGCLGRDEGTGLNTNLPEECNCQRPLHVSYSYTTHLIATAEKKGCAWSKGAAAQAEDLAAVIVHNIKTGDLTALDAGKYMVSRKCDSGWNPNWWINLVRVGASIASYYVTTLGPSATGIPTQAQIDDLVEAIEVLIGTPFANQSGSCGTTDGSQVLVSNTKNLTLQPNLPLRISMYSSYYAKVRGYGCWIADAGIASDYYLLGVVESENTEDPECCADKFATYIVGSLSSDSAPSPTLESDVELDAINTIQNRLNSVAYDLALYGTWYNHHVNPFTGYIDDLVHEFDRLRGESCTIDLPFMRLSDSNTITAENNRISLSNDNTTINLELKSSSPSRVSLFDMTGRLIQVIYAGDINPGSFQIDIPTHVLPNGGYIVNFRIGELVYNHPIFIAK